MADLRSTIAGITSPNPFWLASAPPTDKEYNVVRAFKAGWGGVVWKTLGEDPPVVNVSSRYGAIHDTARNLIGFNNIELISDRPLQINLDEIKQVKREWPDRALVGSMMAPHSKKRLGRPDQEGRGDRRRRDRTQSRLSARHVRARHGLGRGPGARDGRTGDALGEERHPHARPRQAHAQHHQHSVVGRGGQAGRRRRGLADQHGQFADHRRSRPDGADADGRRQGHPWRLLRSRGQSRWRCTWWPRSAVPPKRAACRSRRSAASAPGATRPSSWRWAPTTCRSARRPWCRASASSRT